MTPGSVPVSSKNYVFDPRPHFPFRIVAKRYWIGEHCPDATDQPVSKTQQDALTLVFLHGSGAHKEHWEPTIQRLFDNEHTVRSALRFHDMWALDMPNHGDSAILNEDALRWGYDLCKLSLLMPMKSHSITFVYSFMGRLCSRSPFVPSGTGFWCGC